MACSAPHWLAAATTTAHAPPSPQVSVNDIVIKAAALALAEVPAANSLWDAAQEAAVSAGSGELFTSTLAGLATVHVLPCMSHLCFRAVCLACWEGSNLCCYSLLSLTRTWLHNHACP